MAVALAGRAWLQPAPAGATGVRHPIAGFAWADVLVSGMAVIVWMAVEGRRLGMRRWWLPLFGLSVGVSLALPWFLWLREHHLATRPPLAKP